MFIKKNTRTHLHPSLLFVAMHNTQPLNCTWFNQTMHTTFSTKLLLSLFLFSLQQTTTDANANTNTNTNANANANENSHTSTPSTTSFCPDDYDVIHVDVDHVDVIHNAWMTTIPVYFLIDEGPAAAIRKFARREKIPASQVLTILTTWEEEHAEGHSTQPTQFKQRCISKPLTPTQYFFVEIGTSDFGTLHHQLFLDTAWSGIAVEPVVELLAALPSRPGLFKENAALGCANDATTTIIHRINRTMQRKLNLPHWVLGTGSLDSELSSSYKKQFPGYEQALSSATVPCMTWKALAEKWQFSRYRVGGGGNSENNAHHTHHHSHVIDVVKIDAEGMDLDIVSSMLDWYQYDEAAVVDKVDGSSGSTHHKMDLVGYPRQLVFEAAHQSVAGMTLASVLVRLDLVGYKCTKKRQDLECQLLPHSTERQFLSFPINIETETETGGTTPKVQLEILHVDASLESIVDDIDTFCKEHGISAANQADLLRVVQESTMVLE